MTESRLVKEQLRASNLVLELECRGLRHRLDSEQLEAEWHSQLLREQARLEQCIADEEAESGI